MKCVKGESGYLDCMISGSVMGEQNVMFSKSGMGELYVKETGGSMALKRMNGEHGYVDSMISRRVMRKQYVMDSKSRVGGQ